MDTMEDLDLKWLEQIQPITSMSLDSDAMFESAVCSADFQRWLEGSEGPFLDEKDPAIGTLSGTAGTVRDNQQLPNPDAVAVAGAPAHMSQLQSSRSVYAGAQPAVISTTNPAPAIKQEVVSRTEQAQAPTCMTGMRHAQGVLPQTQQYMQQYQQPLQQQQAAANMLQQPFHQPAASKQQAYIMQQTVPQQLTGNSSIRPAGYLIAPAFANSMAYMQQLPASGNRGTALAPGGYTPAYSTGLPAVNTSHPAIWANPMIPQQLLLAVAANRSAPVAATGAGGSAACLTSSSSNAAPAAAAAAAAVRSPQRGRKVDDSSRGHGGSHARSKSKSKSFADNDDVEFTGPAITKSGIASRRFRARQKQLMTTLEDELSVKLQELQMLQAENESLKLKESVLAAAVESGEGQMRLLQESGPPVFERSGSQPELTKSSSSSALLGHATTPPNSSNTAATDISAHVEADVGVNSTADSAAAQQQQQGVVPAAVDSAEAVKSMTTEDMLASWKQFLRELSRELMNMQAEAAAAALPAQPPAAAGKAAGSAADTTAGAAVSQLHGLGSSTPAAQRLTALVDKYSSIMRMACALNPGAYFRLFGLHIDTGMPAAYTDEHWRSVLAQVNLSHEQVKHILACADLYFNHMARLQQERSDLKAKLKQSDVAKAQLLHHTGLNPGSPWLVGLSSNLKREHMLRIMLNRFIWEKILTPLQAAKACIYSHPFYPDWHAIICVLRDMVRGPATDASLMAAATAAGSSSNGGLRNSHSEADLEQRLLRWREAANASLSQHPRVHLAPGVDFPDLA